MNGNAIVIDLAYSFNQLYVICSLRLACRMKMKIKSFFAKPFAIYIYKQIRKSMLAAVTDQERIFQSLIKTGLKTEFGKEHHFEKIKNHDDFVKNVPIREYEDFKEYIEKIKQGKHNILWKGLPIYL